MRRLDLRPQKKLRNPQRHIRALMRWPERIVRQLPTAEQLAGDRFWNFKIPVFSKVSDPPHATAETRRACLAALFAAADAVERSARRPADCRVAVLATTPFLFESEVTLFSDEDYFRSFMPSRGTKRTELDGGGWIEAGPADVSDLTALAPPAPAGLDFLGGTWLMQGDPEWTAPVMRTNWVWAYPRR